MLCPTLEASEELHPVTTVGLYDCRAPVLLLLLYLQHFCKIFNRLHCILPVCLQLHTWYHQKCILLKSCSWSLRCYFRKWHFQMKTITSENEGNGSSPIVPHMKRLMEREKAQGSLKQIYLSFIWYITDEGAWNCSQFNQFCDIVSHFYIFLSVLIIRHCESNKQCCYLSSDDQSYESTATASYS